MALSERGFRRKLFKKLAPPAKAGLRVPTGLATCGYELRLKL